MSIAMGITGGLEPAGFGAMAQQCDVVLMHPLRDWHVLT